MTMAMPMRRFRRRAPRREHAEPHEREDEDREVEDEPDGEQRVRDERVVVARPDLDLEELVVVGGQEPQGARQHDVVAEGDASGEERGGEQDEDRDDALGVLLKGGREEAPELPEDDRQGDCDRGDEDDLDGREERLCDAERDELRRRVLRAAAAPASGGSSSLKMYAPANATMTARIETMRRERNSSRCSTRVTLSSCFRRRGSRAMAAG